MSTILNQRHNDNINHNNNYSNNDNDNIIIMILIIIIIHIFTATNYPPTSARRISDSEDREMTFCLSTGVPFSYVSVTFNGTFLRMKKKKKNIIEIVRKQICKLKAI